MTPDPADRRPPPSLPERPLRIGIVSSWPARPETGGGTAAAVLGLRRGLEALGHEPVPLTPDGGGSTLLRERIPFNLRLGLRGARATAGLHLTVGVDLDGWALRGPVPHLVALKGVALDEARHESGSAALRRRVAAALEARNARRADRVVVPSRYSARTARDAYGLDPARIAVVPEPILPRRRPGPGEERSRAARPTVLMVAHQYPRKRADLLVRAAAYLRRRVEGLRVDIVGGGPEVPRLRHRVAELGLEEGVAVHGRVDDDALAEAYARAWCFCLPSEQEAFGIAAVEAMAAGLPVVAARAGALPEVVQDGVTGILVEPGDVHGLAGALERLLEADGLRARMGRAGTRVARGRTPEAHARELLEVAGGLLRSEPRTLAGPSPRRPAA